MNQLRARSAAASDGCYEAARASELAGVPQRTLYFWAESGVVVPSVSPVKTKLWSYTDLIALRIVSWLRHEKPGSIPPSPMSRVRLALDQLADLGADLWAPGLSGRSSLLVDRRGSIFVLSKDAVLDDRGQPTLLPQGALDLTGPFDELGLRGPDLITPRAHLRIVPARLAGEPHVEGSRITTLTLAALHQRGYSPEQIASLYDEPIEVIGEALDLENDLRTHAQAAA